MSCILTCRLRGKDSSRELHNDIKGILIGSRWSPQGNLIGFYRHHEYGCGTFAKLRKTRFLKFFPAIDDYYTHITLVNISIIRGINLLRFNTRSRLRLEFLYAMDHKSNMVLILAASDIQASVRVGLS
jgi:hypothetical protein